MCCFRTVLATCNDPLNIKQIQKWTSDGTTGFETDSHAMVRESWDHVTVDSG